MSDIHEETLTRIVECVSNVEPSKLRVLAQRMMRRCIRSPIQFAVLAQGALSEPIIDDLCKAWEESPMLKGSEFAIALSTAAATTQVRNGATTRLVASRPWESSFDETDSASAFIQVIGQARKKLTMAFFVIYELDEIIEALKKAESRGVVIEILIEPSISSGGNIKGHDSFKLLRPILPNTIFYRPVSNKIRAMHAKFVCSDGLRAFVTSANLTHAALNHNFELGILVDGGNIPRQIDSLFDSLKRREIIRKIV